MRNRIIAAVVLAAVLVTGLGAALASPGAAEDPFITLNYLTGTYYPELEQAMLARAQAGTSAVEGSALERLSALSGNYLAQTGTNSFSDSFLRLTLARNDTLTLSTGASLQFDEGRVSLELSSGCLIDVTDGSIVTATDTLTSGHRYLVAEDTTCTITAVSDSVYLSVRDKYVLEQTGTTYTPFVDVVEADWYAAAVLYAYEESLVNGMTATTFEPGTYMNRAMVATVLSRLAGVQGTAPSAGFSDVVSGDWFANGVNWAYSAGIADGFSDGTYRPHEYLTRELLTVFLYRYATNYLNMDAPCTGDLSQFTDADLISPDAQDALSWAVGAGLVNGVGNNKVDPQGTVTRAHVVTILYRFIDLLPY